MGESERSARPAGADPVVDRIVDRLAAAAAGFVAEHRVAGLAAGVVRDGRLAWSGGFGFADRAAGRRIDDDTLFRVASITKTVTATAILQLRDEGRLRLDDPVLEHVPEAAAIRNPFGRPEAVTIRRLLMHTSGLQGEVPPTTSDDYPMLLRDELLARLDEVRVVIPPESAYKYSNVGYELLGLVIERITGRPYVAHVGEAVLGPAGMTGSTFHPDGGSAERCATGYDARDHDDELRPSRAVDSRYFEADGGLWSSVTDLGRWIVANCRIDDADRRGTDGRVLDGRTLREMQRPTILVDATWEEAQGLGWYFVRADGVTWTTHSGTLDGFRSTILFRAEDGVGAIALSNGSQRVASLARQLAALALEAHRAMPPAVSPQPPAATPAAWRDLLGSYRDRAFGDDVRVEVRDGRLVVDDHDEGAPFELCATDDPLVFTVSGGRQAGEACVFLRGPSGTVDRLTIGDYPMVRMVPARPEGSSGTTP